MEMVRAVMRVWRECIWVVMVVISVFREAIVLSCSVRGEGMGVVGDLNFMVWVYMVSWGCGERIWGRYLAVVCDLTLVS